MDFRNLKPFRDYQRSLMLSRRLTVVKVLVALLFVAQLGVFAHLQLVKGAHYRRLAEENRLHRKVERPLRGILLDDQGRVLVTNRPSFSVYMDRERSKDPRAEIRTLARFLGLPEETLLARYERARNAPRYVPVLLLPDVGLDVAARLEAHRPELPAFDVAMDWKRHYPLGTAASHVVGYMSEATEREIDSRRDLFMGDRVGRIGAERVFDEDLRGQPGILLEEVNARGRSLGVVATLRPTRFGRSIRTTIDAAMQRDLEEAFAGRSGAAVFLDPQNGAVRALYSGPGFDPNVFAGHLTAATWKELIENVEKPLQNRALQSAYSPGSTFKILMAAAALEEGVVDPGSTIFCGGGANFFGRFFQCHKKGGHGGMDVHEGIVRSCNVFFYTVGNRLGIEKIAKWGARFGLGQETGLPLRQSTGILPSAAWKEKARGEPWYAGETISVAIGQGYLQVTPIQMAVVAAAIANGGMRVTPHLGERPGESLPPQPIGLSPRTVEIIRSAMVDVVESERGTARRARVPGIRMAGKTGTAQTISREANRSDIKDNAWFIGFGPADRPSLAWAIIVESGGHGGEAAAPIASFVVERAQARTAQAPAPTGAAPGQLARRADGDGVSVR